jgi:hypothetical protein
MSKIIWDASGARVYETGVSHGVLYPMSTQTPGTYEKGVAWNGLSSVSESPSGAEANPIYADNIKYLNLMSAEEFEATIEAYTYPDEFAECDGSALISTGMYATQQPRKQFAFSYRTKIATDTDADAGYKLHIVYGALASPTEKSYESVNDSPEAMTFSWDITTTPVNVTGYKPTAHIVIDSRKCNAGKLATLLETLYGKDAVVEPAAPAVLPTLLMPDAIAAILLVSQG